MPKKKWTYETCFALAKDCKNRSEMKLASGAAYTTARENGWLNDYVWMDSVDRRPPNYWNNYEHCKEEASKYNSISEFEKGCSAAALQAKKHGWNFYGYKCKPKGYWNNLDRCKEIALDCKSRSEFAHKNSAAYMWAVKNGWIDSFDWLVDGRIYDGHKVDCVYAYEFSSQNAVYIGRTLERRLQKRDYEHRHAIYSDKNDKVHNIRDGVLRFAAENKCEIPQIKVLEIGLTIQEGRIAEGKYVDSYKESGWTIINRAKTGKNSSSLGTLDKGKWTYESCKEVALDCQSLSDFKQRNGGAYEAARTNGWLKDYDWFVDTSELISASLKTVWDKNRKWTYESCYELARSCKTPSEFQNKSSRAYTASKEYGWFNDYTWFVSGFSLIEPKKWTKDKCEEIAINCKTRTEFKNTNASAYRSAVKNKWIEDYNWFVDGNELAREERRIYTYDCCFEIARNCATKAEYKSTNSSAYTASRTKGWLKDYTWFEDGKKKDRKWTLDNLKKATEGYVHEREFMLGSMNAYRKARDNNQLNILFPKMKFNFKGYYEVSGFELNINSDITTDGYKYIQFSSKESQKVVYNFYKEEMQQGEGIKIPNIGKRFIALTGFYDMFPKKPSWEKFKTEVFPVILYSFEIQDGIIQLTPLNISQNNEIYRNEKDCILKL